MTANMGTTHTHEQIDAASESLLEWAKAHRNVIAVAAMFGVDDESNIPQPEAIVSGAFDELSETDIAALLAELHATVLMTLGLIAKESQMGEEAFRRLFKTLLNHMLRAAGVAQTDQIESDAQTTDTNTRKEIK
ncbi:MAG: hypothetical protein JKY43_01095 [Phycisphaerales bacterium]|nr:hypothetical protein [Phycisphaerales bacterium]